MIVLLQNMQVAQHASSTGHMQVAPITGNNIGLQRAEVKSGVREVMLCKDQKGMMGLRVRSINKVLYHLKYVLFTHRPSYLLGAHGTYKCMAELI